MARRFDYHVRRADDHLLLDGGMTLSEAKEVRAMLEKSIEAPCEVVAFPLDENGWPTSDTPILVPC